jgi:hypothetical protein
MKALGLIALVAVLAGGLLLWQVVGPDVLLGAMIQWCG